MTDTIFRGQFGRCPCCHKELPIRQARLDHEPADAWVVPASLLRSLYRAFLGDSTPRCRVCRKPTKKLLWVAPSRRPDAGMVFGPLCTPCLNARNTRSVDEALIDVVVYEVVVMGEKKLREWRALARHVLQENEPSGSAFRLPDPF